MRNYSSASRFVSRWRLPLFFVAVLVCLAVWSALTAPTANGQSEPAQPNAPTIVGGREADPGEWPWQVALIHAGGDPYDDQYCGGTLISPLWVVTAAHCAQGKNANQIQVLAGIHNLRTPDRGFLRLDVARIILHPDYGQATQYDSDIALLELSAPATFRPMTSTQLPIDGVITVAADIGPLTGAEATVTGWGNTSSSDIDYPDTLQEVEVPILANADCSRAYPDGITGNMVCAGVPQGGRDSCQGDSGGPLVIFNDQTSRWELAGIVSWGYGCALPGLPGVYTRVSSFTEWITQESGVGYPNFRLAVAPAAADVCAGTTVRTTVSIASLAGFDQPVELSLVGLPPGGSASFQPPVISPSTTSVLSIDTTSLPSGHYELLVRGTAGAITHGAALTLEVTAAAPQTPQLLAPAANVVGYTVAPRFAWTAVSAARQYRLQVADGPSFQHIVREELVDGTAAAPADWLEPDTPYYWRVAATNACGPGAFSPIWRLTTGRATCRTPNLAIPEGLEGGIADTITITTAGTLSDLDVWLKIAHEDPGDLRAWLTYAPTNEKVALFDHPGDACSSVNDINALFDDDADIPVGEACSSTPPAIGGRLSPAEPLAAFDSRPLAGAWRLSVEDLFYLRAGRLQAWCLLPSLAMDMCDRVTDISRTECAALDALFTATDGWNWAKRAGWLDGTKACQWQGVSCAGGHVTALRLPDNGLTGPLPAAVGALSELQALDLSGNAELAGPLPAALTALSLGQFYFNGTALCAPPGGDFTGWLNDIDDLRVSGNTCAQSFLPLLQR